MSIDKSLSIQAALKQRKRKLIYFLKDPMAKGKSPKKAVKKAPLKKKGGKKC